MTEELKKTITEEIGRLPKEGQQVIATVDWVNIAEAIGKKYALDEDEINNFQLETLLVLIGSTDSEFYAFNIENQVETTKDIAQRMAKEAFEKIFTPIRDTLEKRIRKDVRNKRITWQQCIEFILSGGNYLAFFDSADAIDDDEYKPKVIVPVFPRNPGDVGK